MTERSQRRADQQEKVAAMPLTKRIAMVVGGVLATIAGVALVGFLLDGEVNVALMSLLGVAMAGVFAYQYLWAPSRRS